jgi:hypothetical protein
VVKACTGVLYEEGAAIRVNGRSDANVSAIRLHVDRIGDEISERLAQLDLVSRDLGDRSVELDVPAGRVALCGSRGCVSAELFDAEVAEMQRLRASDREER